MKLVINQCFGGFSLSAAAMKRMAELQGRPCFFFRREGYGPDASYVPVDSDAQPVGSLDSFWLVAFDVPNPGEIVGNDNDLYRRHQIESHPKNRADAVLVQAVEELGAKAASGALAELSIVEIPDDVQYEIEEYDGVESIHEVHRSWS